MGRVRANSRQIMATRRGQIVQRVLVDGWSLAQTAAAFGVAERQVARWVAAYRRYGMASLREDARSGTGTGAANGRTPHRWIRRLRLAYARIWAALRPASDAEPEGCVSLRRRRNQNAASPQARRRL